MLRVCTALILWLSLCSVLWSQGKFDPEVDLAGQWNASALRTEELGKIELPRGPFTHPLQMLPVARRFKFADDQVTYLDSKTVTKFKVKSFDSDSGLLVLGLETKWDSVIRFEVLDKDTLALDCTAAIGGPAQVVYTREGTGKVPSLLSQISGDWILDRAATSRLWKSSGTVTAVKNFSDFGNQALEDAETLSIADDAFEFSDESFAPWRARIKSGEAPFLLLNQYHKPNFEIDILSQDVIQFFDKDRNLLAIYKRNEQVPVPKEGYAPGKFARQTLLLFEENKPRKNQHIGKKHRVSGSVSFRGISTSQIRSSVQKTSSAKIELGIRLKSKHYAARERHIYEFKVRNEIVDDTGSSLADAIAQEDLPSRDLYTTGSVLHPDGSIDLTMTFLTSSPAASARVIKDLSGTIEIFRMQRRSIRFKDVAKLEGELLTHPYLNEESILAGINKKNPKHFELKMSEKAEAMISSWHLAASDGNKLQSSSSGTGGGTVRLGFRDPIPKNVSLVINLIKKIPLQEAPFEFKDIKLP